MLNSEIKKSFGCVNAVEAWSLVPDAIKHAGIGGIGISPKQHVPDVYLERVASAFGGEDLLFHSSFITPEYAVVDLNRHREGANALSGTVPVLYSEHRVFMRDQRI